jgi:hypothetical protein
MRDMYHDSLADNGMHEIHLSLCERLGDVTVPKRTESEIRGPFVISERGCISIAIPYFNNVFFKRKVAQNLAAPDVLAYPRFLVPGMENDSRFSILGTILR